jgi:alpha-beta hydrolase superfamily lysophospholipase
LLGISAAPDFTQWGFEPAEKAALQRDGRIEIERPDGSTFLRTLAFWQSGQAMRLLDAPIHLSIPVRLVHGSADDVVPTAVALRLLDRLESPDAQLRLIKGANHNLSTAPDLAAILAEIDALVELTAAHPHVDRHRFQPEDPT